MTKVLVLGNGISRLSYDEFIRSWLGEIWGCNCVYLEYGALLSRLAGHKDVLAKVAAEMPLHEDWTFQLWAGHLGAPIRNAERFTCPKRFQNDSGTTLVAQALHEGHDVVACGFDLGGWDIHSPELENAPKWNWVDRWRELLKEYGADRVRFIGHNHKPFLMSDQPSDAYCHRYLHGKPHIADSEYIAVWERFTGRTAGDLQEECMTKVRFKDGREVVMKDLIAQKMAKKGKVKILKSREKEDPDDQTDKSEKKRGRPRKNGKQADENGQPSENDGQPEEEKPKE